MAEGFKILDAYVEVRADASKVGDDAARQIRGQAGKFNSAGSGLGSSLMGGMQGVIGGLVGGVTSALTAPLVAGVGKAIEAVTNTAKSAIFDYNSTLEQANIGFTTILGSADKARGMLADLQKFAKETPFEFTDVTTATQRLMAMGVSAKNVIPYLTAIGDAAAGLGSGKEGVDRITTAIGQMTAKTTVQGDEILQLTEAGVPALRILAEAYGTTATDVSKMITKGQILSKDAVPALITGLEKGTKTTAGFGGMMDKQSKTMVGSLSNIKDSINQTISTAFLPMFKIVERVTGQFAKFTGSSQFTDFMADLGKNVTGWMSKIGKAFNQVIGDDKVQASFRSLGTAIGKAMDLIGPALDRILPNLVKFGKEIIPTVVKVLEDMLARLPTVIDWFDRFTAGLAAAGPVISGVTSFLSGVAGTIMDIVTAIMRFQGAIGGVKVPGVGTGGGGTFGLSNSSVVGSSANGAAMSSDKAAASAMGAALTKAATAPVLSALGGGSGSGGGSAAKPPSLSSIFKVFETYGKQVAAGLKTGLLGSTDQIKAAAGKMRDAVKTAFDDDYLSKGRENAMLTQVTKVTNRLIGETKRREHTITVLNAANDKLKDLKSDRAGLLASVRDGIMGEGDIGSIFEAATTESRSAAAGSLDGRNYQASYTTSVTKAGTGIGGVRAKLRTLLSNTKAFTANLKQLVKNGLDRFTVQELFAAGATAGLPITRELLADKSAFNDIVSLQKQLASAAGVLGEFAGATTYDASIGSATANVNRLRDKRDNITAVMIVEARKIDEVDKVVKAVNALAKTAKAKKAGAKK